MDLILLVPPYFLIALFVGGSSMWNGEYASGFALIGASYLAMTVGITARNAWQGRSDFAFSFQNDTAVMVLVATVMLAGSLALMHFLDLAVWRLDGNIWALIGIGVGMFSHPDNTGQEDTEDAKDTPDPER